MDNDDPRASADCFGRDGRGGGEAVGMAAAEAPSGSFLAVPIIMLLRSTPPGLITQMVCVSLFALPHNN